MSAPAQGRPVPVGSATAAVVAALVYSGMRQPTPTGADVDEWVRRSTALPPGTPVVVKPPRGGPWRGRVDSWTAPGTGALMAWVVPGGDAPVCPGSPDARVLVASRFVHARR